MIPIDNNLTRRVRTTFILRICRRQVPMGLMILRSRDIPVPVNSTRGESGLPNFHSSDKLTHSSMI